MGMLSLVALADQDVVSFFHDHGLDLIDPTWEYARAFLGAGEHLHAVDPMDYEATWSLDGETLSVRIDEDGSIVEVRRD
jgi:hypothetical protein